MVIAYQIVVKMFVLDLQKFGVGLGQLSAQTDDRMLQLYDALLFRVHVFAYM